MLLARGTARRKEIAIRLALGGSRNRIVRQLLTEGLSSRACGLVDGLALVSDLLLPRSVKSCDGYRLVERPNPAMWRRRMLLRRGTICLRSGLRSSSLAQPSLEIETTSRRRRASAALEILSAQSARRGPDRFSLALVTAAALFIRGAAKAASVETDCRPRVSSSSKSMRPGWFDQKRAGIFTASVRRQISALPACSTPASRHGSVRDQHDTQSGLRPAFAPRHAKPATRRRGGVLLPSGTASERIISQRGIAVLRGRTFRPPKRPAGGPAVAIIDEALAKKLWPDGEALGEHIQFPVLENAPLESGDDGSGEINARADRDHRHRAGTRNDCSRRAGGSLYLPFSRGFQNNFSSCEICLASGERRTRRGGLAAALCKASIRCWPFGVENLRKPSMAIRSSGSFARGPRCSPFSAGWPSAWRCSASMG